jgi:hypothetical protein
VPDWDAWSSEGAGWDAGPEAPFYIGSRFVGTPDGDLAFGMGAWAQGMGAWAQGMGYFLLEAAKAESIHTDTMIRQNEYHFGCEVSAGMRRQARRALAKETRDLARDAIYARVRYAPNDTDIEDGDALNALARELTDPSLYRSLRPAEAVPLPVGAIERIPWFASRSGVVVAPGRLRASGRWPVALRSPAFERGRRAYDRAVEEALQRAGRGRPSPAASDAVDRSIGDLRALLEVVPRHTSASDRAGALVFLEGLSKAARMLREPAAAELLAILPAHPGISVADLLEVIRRHHLQFAAAESPAERALYQDLYPLLVQQGDLVVAHKPEPGPDVSPHLSVGEGIAKAGRR